MARYLNLSELAHVRWMATEAMCRRRPRRAGRVRSYVAVHRPPASGHPPRSLRPPQVPGPRRLLDTEEPPDVLQAVLAGLQRLGVAL